MSAYIPIASIIIALKEANVVLSSNPDLEITWTHGLLPDGGAAQLHAIIQRILRSFPTLQSLGRPLQFVSLGSGREPIGELAIILCLIARCPELVIEVTLVDPLYSHDDIRTATRKALCDFIPLACQGRVRLVASLKDDAAGDPLPLGDVIVAFNMSRDLMMFPINRDATGDDADRIILISLIEDQLEQRRDLTVFAHRNRACKVMMHSVCTAKSGASFVPNFLLDDIAAWSSIRHKLRQPHGQFGRIDTGRLYDAQEYGMVELMRLREFIYRGR